MLNEGTIKLYLECFFAIPPLPPKKQIEKIFLFFAFFNTLIIFLDLPEVEIAINRSFLSAKASKFRSKIFSKPKSFPQAVIVEVSCAKLKTGKGLLLILGLNLIKNSADKCWASAADPPLPQRKTFPPLLKVL